MTETTRTEYRIESRRPRGRKWEYLPATMTQAKDRETAEAYKLRNEQLASPGWRFRITCRRVTTIATEWVEPHQKYRAPGD
jgi:hypothetical protein